MKNHLGPTNSSHTENFRPTWAEIDLGNLRANFAQLQKWTRGNWLCPVIKANAYGHGDEAVAKALHQAGCQQLAVGMVEEGLSIRKSLSEIPVLVFAVTDRQGSEALAQSKLTPVVSTFKQIETLKGLKFAHGVHLKIDTGMERLGFHPAESLQAFLTLQKQGHQISGLMTHLASSSEDEFNNRQLLKFWQTAKQLPQELQMHSYNSDGLAWGQKILQQTKSNDQQWTDFLAKQGSRPGIALYGYCEDPEFKNALQPVMSVRSKFSRIHQIPKGASVSYCGTWKADRTSWIGTLQIGYADGFLRALSNTAQVLVQGRRFPVVGRVCMDYVMVDLTDAREPQNMLDDVVTIFGKDATGALIGANEVGKWAGTISYEVLTAVSARVPRNIIERTK